MESFMIRVPCKSGVMLSDTLPSETWHELLHGNYKTILELAYSIIP